MTMTVHLSYFLALLTASQGLNDSLLTKDTGPRPLELTEVFKLFQIKYNRSYTSPAEYAHRLNIFAHNLAQAQKLQEEDLGTAEFGETPFSDLTEEEFGQLYGHQKAPERIPDVVKKAGFEKWGQPVPSTCDWRKARNIISSIKNQKTCRCCWAIAAADNIESLWHIKTQEFVEVSVQELLDCERCGNGCNGGFVWDAYIAVLNNSGLASEKDYPFKGYPNPHGCLANRYKKVAWIQDFTMLDSDEQAIAGYLAAHGPITVTINMKLLQSYRKGVIKATPTTCDPQHVDHSVLLVGFGKGKGEEGIQSGTVMSQTCKPRKPRRSVPYWILKNSWGAKWGEKGYFRLYRGNNSCGITKYPITARLDHSVKKLPISCPP
ncbi:cathepsin W isoform X1 [Mesocricetus auratus]|uniref:Cathepsin W n=1 Tax=Mesocricetus auratus TaxID=10036 RepID=A0A1U7QBD9_MESAU|nr:cathepsin W isoform X1 [Mesocricetus auratus]